MADTLGSHGNGVGRQDFIGAMRAIASSVAVITTSGDHGRHGATVSSYCSVSADPPSMLACLHAKGRIAMRVSGNGRFCLNVLAQEMAHVADRFSGRHDEEVEDRFEGIEVFDTPGHSPVIAGAMAFHCRVRSTRPVGSHLVIIGEVTGIAGSIAQPLTYLNGAYRSWIS